MSSFYLLFFVFDSQGVEQNNKSYIIQFKVKSAAA